MYSRVCRRGRGNFRFKSLKRNRILRYLTKSKNRRSLNSKNRGKVCARKSEKDMILRACFWRIRTRCNFLYITSHQIVPLISPFQWTFLNHISFRKTKNIDLKPKHKVAPGKRMSPGRVTGGFPRFCLAFPNVGTWTNRDTNRAFWLVG